LFYHSLFLNIRLQFPWLLPRYQLVWERAPLSRHFFLCNIFFGIQRFKNCAEGAIALSNKKCGRARKNLGQNSDFCLSMFFLPCESRMKRITVLFILFIAASPLQARELIPYIGPHLNYTRLKFDQTEDVDGYLGGVTAGLEYYESNFVAGIEFIGSWDTNSLRGDPAQKSSVEAYFLELKAGHQFKMCQDSVVLYPYVGFGWDRFSNKQLPDTGSICYRYDKLFVPVGIYVNYCCGEGLGAGLQFEWRPDVYSKLHLESVKMDNEREDAFRVQTPLRFRLCSTQLLIVPFFDWTRYGSPDDKKSNGASLNIPCLIRWDVGLRALFCLPF